MGGRNDFYDGPFLGGYMNFNKDKYSISSTGKLCCPPLKKVKDGDLQRVYYYSIFHSQPHEVIHINGDMVL